MLSTYITLNNKSPPPSYNTTLKTRKSLVVEPKSTPSLTSMSANSKKLALRQSYRRAQTYDTRIHQLHDSTMLGVSTLASSTLIR